MYKNRLGCVLVFLQVSCRVSWVSRSNLFCEILYLAMSKIIQFFGSASAQKLDVLIKKECISRISRYQRKGIKFRESVAKIKYEY